MGQRDGIHVGKTYKLYTSSAGNKHSGNSDIKTQFGLVNFEIGLKSELSVRSCKLAVTTARFKIEFKIESDTFE